MCQAVFQARQKIPYIVIIIDELADNDACKKGIEIK